MFTIETNQNPFVVAGTARMEAVLTITAPRDLAIPRGPSAFGLLLDVSGSMKGAVLDQAKVAAKRALELLDPETRFFVVAFQSEARVIAPLAPATDANKEKAARAIQGLEAEGGTGMSAALAAARREIARLEGARGHVLFLTDGKNAKEDQDALRAELVRCSGVFQADCRGVGTDWEVPQLREIAEKLLGTAQIVPDASGLEKDFREAIERALGQGISNVRVRLALPRSGQVKLVLAKQMSPRILELAPEAAPDEPCLLDLPLGAWAAGESRDVHVAFEMPAGKLRDEMLLARPSVVFGRPEQVARGKPILAAWTEAGDERSALLNSQVAHYTGQVELATSIQQGLALRARGDVEQATVFLGRALAAARVSGNEQATLKLREVVQENPDGTVKLRADVAKAKVMDLDLASVVTARAPRKAVLE
jgi:uncharacterized protein YegL